MNVESFPSNITYWGAVVFEKWVKQCHENTFVNDENYFRLMRWKIFSLHCFTHFPKTTAPQHVIFSGKLSTISIFKLLKFSVNLWTLCFLSYKSYIDPLTTVLQSNVSKNAVNFRNHDVSFWSAINFTSDYQTTFSLRRVWRENRSFELSYSLDADWNSIVFFCFYKHGSLLIICVSQ